MPKKSLIEGILSRNVGVDWTRAKKDVNSCGQINLERIFMEEWNKQNKDVSFINSGLGMAQLLMIVSKNEADLFDGPGRDDLPALISLSNSQQVCVYNLTEREHRIIATIIQWLGTNIGFSFLIRCLNRANYYVKEIEPEKPKEKEIKLFKKFKFIFMRNKK